MKNPPSKSTSTFSIQLKDMHFLLTKKSRALTRLENRVKSGEIFDENPIHKVYILLDPDTEVPIYVGMGKKSRPEAHTRECKKILRDGTKGRFSHKQNRILKLLRVGKAPVVKIIRSGLTQFEAFKLEIEQIAKIGRYNLKTGPLCNLTDGGDGVSGLSKKAKKRASLKYSETLKNKSREERDATKKKQSQSKLNRSAAEKGLAVKKRKETYARKGLMIASVEKMKKTRRNQSAEIKADRKARELETKMAKSDAEKRAIVKLCKDSFAARTEKEKEATRNKRKETYSKKSEKELKDELVKRGKAIAKGHASQTKEKKPEVSKALSLAFSKRTKEQWEDRAEKKANTLKLKVEAESSNLIKRQIKEIRSSVEATMCLARKYEVNLHTITFLRGKVQSYHY